MACECDLQSCRIRLDRGTRNVLCLDRHRYRLPGRVGVLVPGKLDLAIPDSVKVLGRNFDQINLLQWLEHLVKLCDELAVLLMSGPVGFPSMPLRSSVRSRTAPQFDTRILRQRPSSAHPALRTPSSVHSVPHHRQMYSLRPSLGVYCALIVDVNFETLYLIASMTE